MVTILDSDRSTSSKIVTGPKILTVVLGPLPIYLSLIGFDRFWLTGPINLTVQADHGNPANYGNFCSTYWIEGLYLLEDNPANPLDMALYEINAVFLNHTVFI